MAGFDGLGLFPVEIDVYKKHKVSTINAHEDDANGRGLLVTLLKDGVPFNTTGIDLKLAFRNAIGEERLFAFNTVDLTNGKYSVTYPREMLEGNGGRVVRVEIKAYDTATQAMISYSPLNVYVSEAVVTEGQLVANSEGSEFVQLLERVETVETGLGSLDPVHIANVVTLSENAVQAEADRVLAESGRVSAESSRASAESGRTSAESARATAESNRSSAESSRVSVENARVLSENARVSSEDTRVFSESARVSAESTRATAEGVRVNAESNRQAAESARVVAESSRVNAESARSSNEAERILNEDDRVADEALRVSAESTRASNEIARGTAESNRVNAESARVTAESLRVTAEGERATAETGRNNAESSRVTAEQGRVTAEQTRASFYDGFNAQLADITLKTNNYPLVKKVKTRSGTVNTIRPQLYYNNELYLTLGNIIYKTTDISASLSPAYTFASGVSLASLIRTATGTWLALYSLAGVRKIARSTDLLNWTVVLDNIASGMIASLGWDSGNGKVLYGEYTTDTVANVPTIKLYASLDDGLTWSVAKTWPRAGAGSIRHIHCVKYDTFSQKFWIATGDALAESFIYSTTDGSVLTTEISAHASLTAVSLAFDKRYVFWGKDLQTADDFTIHAFNKTTKTVKDVGIVNNVVYDIIKHPKGYLMIDQAEDAPQRGVFSTSVYVYFSYDGFRWERVYEIPLNSGDTHYIRNYALSEDGSKLSWMREYKLGAGAYQFLIETISLTF